MGKTKMKTTSARSSRMVRLSIRWDGVVKAGVYDALPADFS
jgi:hypothetical protein